MKRNLAFLLIMTSATLAQTPAVAVKPVAKPSAASVKVAPQTGAKAQPSTAKVSAAPAPKPATASVQVAPAKPAVAASVKPSAVAGPVVKAATTTPKSASTPAVIAAKPVPEPAKVAVGNAKVPQAPAKKVVEVKVPVKEAPKAVAVKVPAKQLPAVEAKGSIKAHTTVAVQDTKANEGDKKPAPKTINAVGRRDPFVSPVVKLGAIGSGCSSGKRCLAIEQIALKGVVRSDVGMIAVVVNAAAKAYFLRENDPVFNGYVVKITGDSIVFKESFKDRLGKPLTRDVTKSISRPAV
jgi:hypothetical protein